MKYPFQVGNLVGLCLMEELCLTMILKKMPGKVARAALKFQFVKSKVCITHFILCAIFLCNVLVPLEEEIWSPDNVCLLVCRCVLVHSSDSTRVDLTIPGEQYFYLRAINAAERQKWLVALGTAKACLTDNRTKREKGEWMPLHPNLT